MFINIGDNQTVRSKEIIVIIDQSASESASMIDEMIDNKQKQSKVIGSRKKAKSIIITKDIIYLSSLSVLTLKKRSSIFSGINKAESY